MARTTMLERAEMAAAGAARELERLADTRARIVERMSDQLADADELIAEAEAELKDALEAIEKLRA
jgi:Na+/phosphate symporter